MSSGPFFLSHDLEQDFKVILFGCLIPTLHLAARASEQNPVIPLFGYNVNWFHHPLAGFFTVAWIDIHMLTPQTHGAVIGVPVALHRISAVLAIEVFYLSLKFLAHFCCPFSWQANAYRVTLKWGRSRLCEAYKFRSFFEIMGVTNNTRLKTSRLKDY